MRAAVLSTLVLASASSSVFAAPSAVRIDLAPRDGALQVDVRYRADRDGPCLVELPNEWADQQRYYEAVHDLRLVDSNAALRETDKPHVRSFDCRRGQAVHLRYALRQESPEPVNNARRYRFMMSPAYLHTIGYAAWVLPKAEDGDRLRVDLRWSGLPPGWSLADSYGTAPRQTAAGTYDQFRSSLFVAGDFRMQAVKDDAGRGVTVAMRGDWPFSDKAFADQARRIIGMERDFWRSKEANFLVTLIPLSEPPGHKSVGGTGVTGAFATYLTPNATLDDLSELLAHEYFHNWNAQQLGNLPEPEQVAYWINEGFTDYYASLLLLRSGQTSLEQYVAYADRLLKKVYMSPVREADNRRVVQDFWKDQDVQKLPYNRGTLLAMEWQAQIDAASGGRRSFDDVMYALQRQAVAAEKRTGKLPPLDAARVTGVLQDMGATDPADEVRRHIDEGRLIVPRAAWFGPAVELRQVEMPVFELGLDFPKLREKVVAGVVEGSAAHAAGLRNGQRVVQRTPIHWGDTDEFMEVTVEGETGQRTFRYLPRAAQTRMVPQFALRADASAADLARTRHLLGMPDRAAR